MRSQRTVSWWLGPVTWALMNAFSLSSHCFSNEYVSLSASACACLSLCLCTEMLWACNVSLFAIFPQWRIIWTFLLFSVEYFYYVESTYDAQRPTCWYLDFVTIKWMQIIDMLPIDNNYLFVNMSIQCSHLQFWIPQTDSTGNYFVHSHSIPRRQAVVRLFKQLFLQRTFVFMWLTFVIAECNSWISNYTGEGVVCFADVRWYSSCWSAVSVVARNLWGLISVTLCLAAYCGRRMECFVLLLHGLVVRKVDSRMADQSSLPCHEDNRYSAVDWHIWFWDPFCLRPWMLDGTMLMNIFFHQAGACLLVCLRVLRTF